MQRQGRRRGTAYPVWIGIAALVGLSVLWALRPERDPLTASPASTASNPASTASAAPSSSPATTAEPARPIPELRWLIDGAPALSGQALGGCLRAAGWARLTAHGGGAHPLSVTHGSLILPILLTVEGKRTQIRTRLPARRHQGIALHTAVAGCLPGTRLEDAALGELAQADTWPSARRDSGLRAELLMRIAPSAKGLTLRGLGRLGLKDLVFDAPDTPATRRRLLQAGTLLLLQDDPRATTLPFGESEARLNPSPQPGLENAHRIDLPVPPVAPITAPPVSKRPRARPVRRPKARRGSPKTPKSAPRTTPRRPTPATPRWRPDYVD